MTWDDLTMADKAKFIRLSIQNGISNLSDIRNTYNQALSQSSEKPVNKSDKERPKSKSENITKDITNIKGGVTLNLPDGTSKSFNNAADAQAFFIKNYPSGYSMKMHQKEPETPLMKGASANTSEKKKSFLQDYFDSPQFQEVFGSGNPIWGQRRVDNFRRAEKSNFPYMYDMGNFITLDDDLAFLLSTKAMGFAHARQHDKSKAEQGYVRRPTEGRPKEYTTSVAMDSYLLPRDKQKRRFYEAGYIEGTPGDYGLVKKAVGNRNIPIFQTAPDAISRDQLVVFSNDEILGNLPPEAELIHAGDYPSATYVGPDNKIYEKDWDLNDYGVDAAGNHGTIYDGFRQTAANMLDQVGSPVVVTTGFQPVFNSDGEQATLENTYKTSREVRNFIHDRGLVPYYGDTYESILRMDPDLDFDRRYNQGPPIMFTLPPLNVYGKKPTKQ